MSLLPPAIAETNQQPNQSSAFAAALIKAKQVAAKIKSDDSSETLTPPQVGQKRPLDEDSEGPSDKRQSFGMAAQVTSEQVMVPDKMVGLIIGKGGEQITRLQAETGCKIQMAADSGGMPERLCTLTGPMSAIAQAKVMIEGIIANEGAAGPRPGGGGMPGQGGMPGGGGGGGHFEIMIPGHKVGLVIGKGGETIKLLQEQTGAKMIIIQESNAPTEQKPLRITGAPDQVERAKTEVFKILNANDNKNGGGMGGVGGRGGYHGGAGRGRGGGGGAGWPSGGPGDKVEYVTVSSSKVGLVIGKGGETIKSINQASGAHVEIDRNAPQDAMEKNFLIKGSAEAVERAKNMVLEKIGAIEGSGYGAFPGQTFIPGGGGRGGGHGGQYGGGPGGHYGAPGGQPAAGGPMINPATGQPDYSAQWADYYRSLGMTKEAEQIEHQMPQQQPQAAPQPAAAPDYSAQWAEYYRSIGKTKEAEQIEAQIRAKGAGAPAPGGGQPYGQPQQYYQPQGGYPPA